MARRVLDRQAVDAPAAAVGPGRRWWRRSTRCPAGAGCVTVSCSRRRRWAAVMRTLSGRDGALRLRPLTTVDLRPFDLAEHSGCPACGCASSSARWTASVAASPAAPATASCTPITSSTGATADRPTWRIWLLVCSRHHTLVHAQGFDLTLDDDRRLSVATADGVPVLHRPALPSRPPVELDPDQRVSAKTLPPDTVTARMDLGYAVMVLARQAA
jgi:hypothetical protein